MEKLKLMSDEAMKHKPYKEPNKISLPDREFNVNDVVYQVISTNEGGVNVYRHEIKQIGWVQKEISTMKEAVLVKETVILPVINSDKMKEDEFKNESYFCTIKHLDKTVKDNLNRKKLW